MHSHHDKTRGWQPFWAALGAALLVLLPLVGGTILLTRQSLRTKLAAKPQSGGGCPDAKDRKPAHPAGLHRRRAAGLRAALPQRQPELHPVGGAACGDCHPLWAGGGHAGPVLCRGRPSPLPGSFIGASGSARDHPLSRSLPQCPGRHRGPVRDAAGGLFRRAHRRRAGPVRPFRRGAGLSRPGRRRVSFPGGTKTAPSRPATGLPPGRRCGTRFSGKISNCSPRPSLRPSGPTAQAADRPDSAGLIDTGKHTGVSGQRQCRCFRRRAARRVEPHPPLLRVDGCFRASVQTLFNVWPTEAQAASSSEP